MSTEIIIRRDITKGFILVKNIWPL